MFQFLRLSTKFLAVFRLSLKASAPRGTSVGAFHLAYIEKIPEARKWRCRSDSGGVVLSLSQIEGGFTGRTSKEGYEQLILEL